MVKPAPAQFIETALENDGVRYNFNLSLEKIKEAELIPAIIAEFKIFPHDPQYLINKNNELMLIDVDLYCLPSFT